MAKVKLKTHKGTASRVRITKTGKALRRRAFSNHFLQKKSASRKRQYAGMEKISGKNDKNTKRKMGI